MEKMIKNMSLELLYKNNINRKNEVIEYIDTDIILKTSIINYWNNYKIKIVNNRRLSE